ncbi:TOBE domain-containing protein [Nocardioides guangzhouensis]|uniref:TOBE domain-containing protein n=1 Tax=Nocardioides guangzhouensis TaxID=2497878 RepID=UPI001FE92751|nr:TOBE domain-containing protein [Nocardioides guangzhouensis]
MRLSGLTLCAGAWAGGRNLAQSNITVGVRPEAWRIEKDSEHGLPVQVTVVEELGSDAYVYGTCGVEGTPSNVIIRVSGRDHVQKGETVFVTTDPRHVHVFDTDTGERLSD